jgi:hypothetical protein
VTAIVCCFSLIAVVVGLFLILRVANNIGVNSPEVFAELKRDALAMLPGIVFWTPLGSIFGAIGAISLMWFVGIPLTQANGWVLGGAGIGGVWGVLWGIIYGLTERQK